MLYIVKTCSGREGYLPYLKAHLPAGTIFCHDDTGRGAMGNFLKALRLAGHSAAVHMEDDIVLTRDFETKITAVIERFALAPIQFFSMRKKDLSEGSRWEPGRTYLMNQCHYLPPGMSADLAAFYEKGWTRERENPHGTDTMLADYLAHNRIYYWLHVPSLVDHRVGKSLINPRRASTNRQSFTFTDPIPE